MFKKFLFIIALILYVGNSNCVAAKEDFEIKLHKSMIAFKDMNDVHKILSNFNELLDELRSSKIDEQAKKSKLEKNKKTIIGWSKVLDISQKELKVLLRNICAELKSDCLNNNKILGYDRKLNRISWRFDNRKEALDRFKKLHSNV